MRLPRTLVLAATGALLALGAAVPRSLAGPAAVPVYGYRIVHTYPHDPAAFTEGLAYRGGVLYESTGLEGQSSLRRVELTTGRVLARRALAPDLFGEGLTAVGNRLVQLTWTSRRGFVYDLSSLAPQREFAYGTEGWGLTTDGARLIMSDGTAHLYFLDPTSFKRLKTVAVTGPSGPLERINELEYVNGQVLANVWMTDRIARIDPSTGRVTAWIDLSGLALTDPNRGPDDVLNGIAYDPAGKRLFVTGKRWPYLFEVALTGPSGG